MYASRRNGGLEGYHETQLLGRLISALKGFYVNIQLANGSKLVGCVDSYNKRILTANINDSFNDLKLLEASGTAPKVPFRLKEAYSRFKNDNRNKDRARVIKASPPSHVIIKDATISTGNRTFQIGRAVISERWVTTVSLSYNYSETTNKINKSSKSSYSVHNLQHAILQEPYDCIKNAAFMKCNRIGRNNLK
ncbi:hypothetical protein BgAZ_302180 [Babesia gibsoni]|uniref:Uncharacterized protein n=1 Tax=Babesia gibsoni TaxID=33632 RepID=A0AAD8LHD8_BABGI|nr:hypothetical protein BgAZ_302180 [Babesia gibsoni]